MYNAIESAGALLVSFFINLAVVATFAAAFYSEVGSSRCESRVGQVSRHTSHKTSPLHHEE